MIFCAQQSRAGLPLGKERGRLPYILGYPPSYPQATPESGSESSRLPLNRPIRVLSATREPRNRRLWPIQVEVFHVARRIFSSRAQDLSLARNWMPLAVWPWGMRHMGTKAHTAGPIGHPIPGQAEARDLLRLRTAALLYVECRGPCMVGRHRRFTACPECLGTGTAHASTLGVGRCGHMRPEPPLSLYRECCR